MSSYLRVSRAAGVLGLLFLATNLPEGASPFFGDGTPAQIVSWVSAHPTQLYVEGFMTGFGMLLIAGMLGALLWRTGRRGTAVTAALAVLAGNVGVDMIWGGSYYALAKAGQVDAGREAVLTLFYLVQELTFADGFLFGIALVIVGVLSLRTRTLPAPLAWLSLLTGIVHVVATPVQIAATGSVDGVGGPISVVLFLVWLLAISLLLLVRPGWGSRDGQRPSASPLRAVAVQPAGAWASAPESESATRLGPPT